MKSALRTFRAGRFLRWSLHALLICLILYVAWLTSIAFPISPTSGTVLQDSSAVQILDSDTITVGTYNIHSTKGKDGTRSAERISAVLAQVPQDFVALNEVRARSFGLFSQASELASNLGLAWLYLPVEEKLLIGQFGNAFLSRYRIKKYWVTSLISAHHTPSGVQSSHKRNLVNIELEMQGRSVMLLLTHIDRGPLRLQQLQQVLTEFNQYEHAVLLGDLNSDSDDVPLKRILEVDGVVDMIDGVRHEPHIDWILTKGFDVVDNGSHPVGPSDHPHYWAKIRLKDTL